MELDIISFDCNLKPRILKQHFVNGIWTIGEDRGKQFFISIPNDTQRLVAINLAAGRRSLKTGNIASPGYGEGDLSLVQPGEVLIISNWPETMGGEILQFGPVRDSFWEGDRPSFGTFGFITAEYYVEGKGVFPPGAKSFGRSKNHFINPVMLFMFAIQVVGWPMLQNHLVLSGETAKQYVD